MAAIVEVIGRVSDVTGETPVVVGGLAVLSRLTTPYRATTDLDVVDRRVGDRPHLELLRRESDATAIEPAAVRLGTSYGDVRVDVLEVRQIELDDPSDDPGDRLHATSHAWAFETATSLTLHVMTGGVAGPTATARFAEPGPLIAMKLQALMDRPAAKQGTDLQDLVRLLLDSETRPTALAQLAGCSELMKADIRQHAVHWLDANRDSSLRRIHDTGGSDLTLVDLELAADLLNLP